MTLKQLEYFRTIAETGSVTKASEKLNISQPPLSMQLKALEDELGTRLFERHKKHMDITPAGRLLFQRCEEIFELVDQTVKEVRSKASIPQMTIRLGTINSISNRLLPSRIYAFRKAYPHTDVQISEASTFDILPLLDSRKVDIAIVREPFDTSKYSLLRIYDEALDNNMTDCFVALAKPSFFANKDTDTVPLKELDGKPLLLHRRYVSMFSSYCKREGYMPDIICKNNDAMALISWAKAGNGIAVIPYTSALLSNDPTLIMKTINEPMINSRVFVAWNKDSIFPPEIRAFIHMLTDTRSQ